MVNKCENALFARKSAKMIKMREPVESTDRKYLVWAEYLRQWIDLYFGNWAQARFFICSL